MVTRMPAAVVMLIVPRLVRALLAAMAPLAQKSKFVTMAIPMPAVLVMPIAPQPVPVPLVVMERPVPN